MENNENSVTQTEQKTEGIVTETNTKTETEQKQEEKTFTQDEVNALILKATKKMPSKEELKEFNDWKESQKTDAQKQNEKEQEIARLTKENTYYKNMSVVANAGVDSKFQKFVISEVSEMEGEFEDNLNNYLKTNKQYLHIEDKKTNTTGYSQSNTNQSISEEKAYLDKKYANNPYYKK